MPCKEPSLELILAAGMPRTLSAVCSCCYADDLGDLCTHCGTMRLDEGQFRSKYLRLPVRYKVIPKEISIRHYYKRDLKAVAEGAFSRQDYVDI